MKKIVFAFLCISPCLFADFTATQTPPIITPPKPELPIVRPPLRPIRPIVGPVYVQEDYNYYSNVVTSCDEYIRIIEEKDQEINDLKREIERLKNEEHLKLQKDLQSQYEKELKKFDERNSGLKRKNSIDVSDK